MDDVIKHTSFFTGHRVVLQKERQQQKIWVFSKTQQVNKVNKIISSLTKNKYICCVLSSEYFPGV